MRQVKFSIVLLLPIYGVLSNAIVNQNMHNAVNANRKISDKFNFGKWFVDGLYNKKGKPHDLGADYGLTSDLYTKPNPYYTRIERLKRKNANENEDDDEPPRPVYIHTHEFVTQHSIASNPSEQFQIPPTTTSTKSSSSYSHAYSSQSNAQKSSSSSHYYSAPQSSYSNIPPSTDESSYSVQSYASYPSSSYGVPASYYPSSYGTPHSTYGPPPSYGPPMPTMMTMPEAQKSNGEWFLAKLMKKIDLVLISKIMLKLIIFKKIVKFIGLICLLMFIPILKKKFEESYDSSEEDRRDLKGIESYANMDIKIREIADFAFTAIESFQHDNIPWCVGESQFYCRLQYMLDSIDFRYPGTRIISTYFPELQTTSAPPAVVKTVSNPPDNSSENEVSSDEKDDETPIEKFKKIFK